MDDLEKVIGQYIVYPDVLLEAELERVLYMAVPAFGVGCFWIDGYFGE